MGFKHSPSIITKDLYFMCDAANAKHSGTVQNGGTDVNVLYANQRNTAVGTVTGNYDTAEFSTDNKGVWTFDGDQCIKFDQAVFDFSTQMDGTNNFTAEIWFNTSDLPATQSSSLSNVLWSFGGDRNAFIVFGDNSTGNFSDAGSNMSMRLNGTGNNVSGWQSVGVTPVGSIELNRWYNYTISYDQSYFTAYLNGIKTSQYNGNADITARGEFTGLGCLADSNNSNRVNRYFQGKLSKFAFYTRCLKENEVKHNFNAIRGRFGL